MLFLPPSAVSLRLSRLSRYFVVVTFITAAGGEAGVAVVQAVVSDMDDLVTVVMLGILVVGLLLWLLVLTGRTEAALVFTASVLVILICWVHENLTANCDEQHNIYLSTCRSFYLYVFAIDVHISLI